MSVFDLHVSYAQIAVFDSALEQPFNDWSERHVKQGFAWRPGSVSFATLAPSGRVLLEVGAGAKQPVLKFTPERVIQVPFRVPDSECIEIATISESRPLRLQAGEYALTFWHGRSPDGSMWASLVFERAPSTVQPRILVADPGLFPADPLEMGARPA